VDPGFNVTFSQGPSGDRAATVSGLRFSILNTSNVPRDINALFVSITGLNPTVTQEGSLAILENNLQLWYYAPSSFVPPVQITCFNLRSVLQPPIDSYSWTLFYDFSGCPGGDKWILQPGGSMVLKPANAAASARNLFVTYR
jgi:hypothetical protein